MSDRNSIAIPADAEQRRAAIPVVCYSVEQLSTYDEAFFESARAGMEQVAEVTVAPRDADTFTVPAGHFFRIYSVEGSQVAPQSRRNFDSMRPPGKKL